jgi:hypothetical protein
VSESSLWRYLAANMQGRWDACRHEDATGLGTPDVSFGIPQAAQRSGAQGWIELKSVDKWPKRPQTPVSIKHLTHWQRRWLLSRGRTGASCWLLLRIERDYLMLRCDELDEVGVTATRARLLSLARGKWNGRIQWAEFENLLRAG